MGNFINNSTSIEFSSKKNSWSNLRQSWWGDIIFLNIREDSMIFRSYFCILCILCLYLKFNQRKFSICYFLKTQNTNMLSHAKILMHVIFFLKFQARANSIRWNIFKLLFFKIRIANNSTKTWYYDAIMKNTTTKL